MKKYLTLFICACLSVSLFASEIIEIEDINTVASEPETSSIIYDGSAYSFAFAWNRKEKMNVHLPGLSFAFANLDGLENTTYGDLKAPRSYSIGIGLGDFTAHFSHNVALGVGARLDFTRYHFKGDVGLQEVYLYEGEGNPIGKSYTDFVPDLEGKDYKSSKLITYYVTFPVVLEYHTKVNNRSPFFVNAGVEGLVKYYSKSQVDIKESGKVNKVTLGKDLNMPAVNARLVFNIGFDDFGLTAYYQLNSLFKNNRGVDLHPWGIGLAIGF